MKRNVFIPPPTFKHHLMYPVVIGHYYEFPTHRENRESGFWLNITFISCLGEGICYS